MCYSMIDIEDEILELKNLVRAQEWTSVNIIIWRIEQMLNDISIGFKVRNIRILSGICQIKAVIETISDSKNKKTWK